MSVFLRLRKGLMAVAALGALALGGSALADAATSGGSAGTGSSSSGSTATQQQAPQGQPPRDPTKPGGHRGANGQVEQALPSAVAAKVKAAAEAKVPGGTVERVETDVDHGSPYEAHIVKSDGTQLEVLVNADFQVTAANAMQHP